MFRLRFRYVLLIYAICLGYGSLLPFRGWRDTSLLLPGVVDFFTSGLPRFWTAFDVTANVLIYIPMALMISWALQIRLFPWLAGLVAVLLCASFSLSVEWLQVLLPGRVSSLLDWLLNILGASIGAALASLTSREHAQDWLDLHFGNQQVDRWGFPRSIASRSSAPWIIGLVLLWLVVQMVPQGTAFSVGDMQGSLGAWSFDTAQAYAPLLETLGTALSVLVIGLLLQSLLGARQSPLAATLIVFCLAILIKAATASWLLGSSNAFGWFSAASQAGLLLGLVSLSLSSMLLRLRSRSRWWLILSALVLLMVLFNLVPVSDYHRGVLQAWSPRPLRALESLLAWLGLLWPWLALIYCFKQTR